MAGEYSAPGVYRKEIDLSDILVTTGVSNGGTVVRAKKGPVRRPVLVQNNKEYVETFGEPYFKDGLDDKHPVEGKIGGHLVPEYGYGSYGALEFLKESNILYVVRAFDDDDTYAAVEVDSDAKPCLSCSTSAGVIVNDDPLEVYDTPSYNYTYEQLYQNSEITQNLFIGYVGPGEDGNNIAVTVETLSPVSEWLYQYDDYPTETSATIPMYGNDVPEIWIDGTSAVTYTTTNAVETPVLDLSGAPITGCTYDFIPFNAVNYTANDTDWKVYSAQDGVNYQIIQAPLDPQLSNVQSTVSTTGDWKFTANYTSSSNSACNGSINLSGSYTSATGVMNGGRKEVKEKFKIASEIIKISVFNKGSLEKEWDDMYANNEDKIAKKLRIDPVEVFYGTMRPYQDADKRELFIEQAINGVSKNIYIKANKAFSSKDMANDATWDFNSGMLEDSLTLPTGKDNSGTYVSNGPKFARLAGGSDNMESGAFGSDAEFWKYFENREDINVNIIINSQFNDIDKKAVGDLCNIRRDCVGVNQVGHVKMLDYKDILAAEKYGYPAASFMALYAGYSRVYDSYNDKYIYLPNSVFAAAIYARVDRLTDVWYAPAGVARATLNILDQNKRFSTDQRGLMYDRNINAVKYVTGSGFAIMGQKTAQLKKSALDRLNVRRNLIYIQTNIENALTQFVFENNTHQTRLRVFSIIDDFLLGIKSGEGLYDYEVVCDETNNTPSIIDANQLNVDIYVQPVKTIEFIQFTTVITRTGVSFGDVKLQTA